MATRKQIALVKELVESNGSTSMGEAMIKAGYSKNTALNPQQVTKSLAWPELVKKYLDEDKTLSVHQAQLDATKQLSARNGKDANAETDDFIEVPDNQARLKAVELAYKVTGRLKDTSLVQVNIAIPILGDLKAT